MKKRYSAISGARVILITIPKVFLNPKQCNIIDIFNDTLRENVLEQELIDLDIVFRGIPVRDTIFCGDKEQFFYTP